MTSGIEPLGHTLTSPPNRLRIRCSGLDGELRVLVKHGHLMLEVPVGTVAIEALQLYAMTYPELAFAKLSNGRIENDQFVYEVERDKSIGTKG